MNYKDSLTQSFSKYLTNHLILLQITSQIIDVKLKTNIRKGEPQEKRIVDVEFFRSLRIGISRVEYYQKKMKDIDEYDGVESIHEKHRSW